LSTKKIGFWSSTSLVVGNMIGSGVFLLPASLAAYGAISIIGWICASLGAILLAIIFGNLGKLAPETTGGPYAYTRLGLGRFPAYLVAWGYWVSIWCTNAAIASILTYSWAKPTPRRAHRTRFYLGLYLGKFKTYKNGCFCTINHHHSESSSYYINRFYRDCLHENRIFYTI